MSAFLQSLARRLATDPDELAKTIPADTVRRTKYPVVVEEDAQGRRTYSHDLGIQDDARISSTRR